MKRIATTFRIALTRMLVSPRARRLAAIASLALLLAGSSSALAQSGMVIADFNHDGIPDVLLPQAQTGNFLISFGAAPYGTFQSGAVLVPYPSGCTEATAASPLVGDFNGDGIPDLVVACYALQSYVPTLYVMLGNGDGTFTVSTSVAGLSNIAVGDFNHDGKLDIATQGTNATSSQQILFYPGNGDGTFGTAVSSSTPGAFYSTMTAVDLNNDGYPDLAFGNFTSQGASTVAVYGNNQNGTFGVVVPGVGSYSPSVSIPVGSYGTSTDVAVLTGTFFAPGETDIGVVDTGSTPGVFIAQNTSSGSTFSFATPTKTQVTGLQSAATGSFFDSLSDLLVYNGTAFTVLVNHGAGLFSSTVLPGLTFASSASTFATADANGDGYADVYTATTTSTGAALTVNMVSGTATATSAPFSLTPAGTYALSASWPGNTYFSGSTANGSQTVNALGSSTTVQSSLNPAQAGQSITFTATVEPTSEGSFPTGTVTFQDNGTAIGTGTIGNSQAATFTTSALAAGSHTITAVYGGDTYFAGSSGMLTQVVNSNIPVITWANPAAITYGAALSATQLNATAANTQGTAIPGTFTYTPASGTVLNAGMQTLSVTFTPNDLVSYTTASKSVSILVNQATATINWTPAVNSIVYGTALGAQQLNATATGVGGAAVAGSFVYTPASGTVLGAGAQTLGVVFTSTNANYLGNTGTASITVTKATPAITWATPASIVSGTALSGTQLNATAAGVTGAALPGAFVYNPASGTVLAPGSQTLSTNFTPTDLVDYTTATKSVTLNVTDFATITWPTPAAITYGTALSATQLNATAVNSQGNAIAGTFVYTPAAGAVLNAGTQTLSVTFTPTNTAISAVTKTVSLVVNTATPTISWTPAVNSIVYGTALGAQQLNATATGVGGAAVTGTFAYTPASGAVLTAGTQTLGVVFTSTNANYTGTTGSTTITVTQATPTLTWTTPAAIAYGIPLSATQLDATATGVTGAALAGAFVYTPAAGAVLTPGSQTLSATFTPTDLVDYTTATKTVSLTITDIALTAFTPNTATIGDPAKTITITGSGFVTTTVAQINGTPIATTYVSPTSLTAVIPATNFAATGTLLLTLKNPATGSVSGSLSLVVSAPPVTATFSGPSTTAPGSQPGLNLTIPAYPVALTATLTLNVTPTLSSGVTDPNVLFANGQTTYTFTIPANTTTIPTIQLQAGTVAETITIPLVLTLNGVNVTPTGLAPVVITVPTAVPVATAATLVRSGNSLTVTVDGFSNTREIVSATFTFIPAPGASLSTNSITAPVAGVFTTYYATAASVAAGSSFIYTQVFNVDGDASSVGSVQVTLTNSVGVSVTVTAQ